MSVLCLILVEVRSPLLGMSDGTLKIPKAHPFYMKVHTQTGTLNKSSYVSLVCTVCVQICFPNCLWSIWPVTRKRRLCPSTRSFPSKKLNLTLCSLSRCVLFRRCRVRVGCWRLDVLFSTFVFCLKRLHTVFYKPNVVKSYRIPFDWLNVSHKFYYPYQFWWFSPI